VRWSKPDGKWECHNPDGSDHWDLCSKTRFERIKREGEHFETAAVEGYRHPEKVQFVRISAKPMRGKQYRESGCDCGLPPWELCKPDCPHGIQLSGEQQHEHSTFPAWTRPRSSRH
jgi:hypothetical protein